MAQETLPDRSPATGPGDGPGGEPGTGAPRGRLGRLRRGLRSGGRAGWPRTLLAAAAGLVMWPAFPRSTSRPSRRWASRC